MEYKSIKEAILEVIVLKKSNRKNGFNDGPSEQDHRPQVYDRSDEEILFGVGRFSCHLSFPSGPAGATLADRKIRMRSTSQQVERRSGGERRCAKVTRSEVDRFLQGERRSGLDRREFRYMSFKKARAFVRSLGLKSIDEWRDYVKSGTKPGDIPAAPHYIYVNDGWRGWGDWLNVGVVSGYLSKYRHRYKTSRFSK